MDIVELVFMSKLENLEIWKSLCQAELPAIPQPVFVPHSLVTKVNRRV